MSFIKATRTAVPVRMAFTGPTNSGKTLSSLYMAEGIIRASFPEASLEEIYDKIAFIDTERGRAKFYADRDDLPYETSQFNYLEIEAPFHTTKFINAVTSAVELVGPKGVVIIDSLTHAWNSVGGILERKTEKDTQGGNSYTNWGLFTKEQNSMMASILSAKANVIVTMRSKMDYVLEENSYGKMAPKKVGLKPVQRDDTEYEFDITLMLDDTNTATIVKDTTILTQLADTAKNIGKVTPEYGKIVSEWLNQGIDSKVVIAEQKENIIKVVNEIAKRSEIALTWFKTEYKNRKTKDMDIKELKEVLNKMQEIEGA